MRLDEYLKISRLIKRHTLAKEVGDQGRITVNGNVAKAGPNIKAEDVLMIRFDQKLVTVKVTVSNERAPEGNAKSMYEIIEERRLREA